jgi:ferritin-like metal-binding protein YciE
MKVRNLQQFFEHELAEIYSAEAQLIAALPQIIKAANDQELKDALTEHLEITRIHIQRLDDIVRELGLKLHSQVCKGIKGIIDEAAAVLDTISDLATRDAAIILGAQKVEHYEIAVYGGAAQYARNLELVNVANLLETTLEEEKEADVLLTQLAEGGWFKPGLNEKALEE